MFLGNVRDGRNYSLNSDMVPIGSISRQDADTYLVFLAGNGVRFLAPSDDQWYHLQKTPLNVSDDFSTRSQEVLVYYPEEPASPLGCTDQYQFCNPAIPDKKNQCGPLASLRDSIALAAPLFNTSYKEFGDVIGGDDPSAVPISSQVAARFLYFQAAIFNDIRTVDALIANSGPGSLSSQKSFMRGYQGAITSNQWQIDVRNWWDITLAATQSLFVGIASGATDPNALRWQMNLTTPAFRSLCHNQVRSLTLH